MNLNLCFPKLRVRQYNEIDNNDKYCLSVCSLIIMNQISCINTNVLIMKVLCLGINEGIRVKS